MVWTALEDVAVEAETRNQKWLVSQDSGFRINPTSQRGSDISRLGSSGPVRVATGLKSDKICAIPTQPLQVGHHNGHQDALPVLLHCRKKGED